MDPAVPRPHRLPEKIGRYRILSRLGKGAMGIVYCAHDDDMGRNVAVKVMTADAEGDDTARERFLREARVTGRLLHRNIVTVFNAGEDDGRHFIVMELLEGVTLKEWLKSPHTLEEKLDLMIQTCDGLSVAHAAGVIHRDVKPNNLFVLPDGNLKILDFGVARLVASNVTRSGLIIGTPGYMSPEQARGLEVDPRSDVFSAAAVFYFMLAGREPFEGPDLPVVLQHVIHDDPPAVPHEEALAPLFRMVMRGLQKKPEARFASLGEFVADLTRFKRQYEADTRRMVAASRTKYRQFSEQLTTLEQLRESLAMGSSEASAAAADLVARVPTLRGGGPAWARQQAESVTAELSSLHRMVETELGTISTGSQALERGEAAVAAGQGGDALRHLQIAEQHLGPGVTRVRVAEESARQLVGNQDARLRQAQSLAAGAKAAEQAGDLRGAERMAAEAVGLQADEPAATVILSRVRTSLSQEGEAREKRLQQLCDQCAAAASAGNFSEADRCIGEARQLDANHARVTATTAVLEQARRASAEREASQRAANAAIATARQQFARGEHEAAIVSLETLLRGAPASPGVSAEIQRLRTEQAQLAKDAAAAAQVQELVAQAEAEWKRGEVDAALASAERVLAQRPEEARALRVRDQARERLKDLADLADRRTRADQAVRRAVAFMASGAFDRASRESEQALALQPNRPDIRAVLADAIRLCEVATSEAAREKTVRERARTMEQLLHQARVRLRTSDFAGALAAAEQAARLSPSHPGAALVLAQARAVSAATQIVVTDQTVRMKDLPASPVPPSAMLARLHLLWVRCSDRVTQWRRAWRGDGSGHA